MLSSHSPVITETLTADSQSSAGSSPRSPCLIFAMRSDAPRSPAVRYVLHGLRELRVGRGNPGLERVGSEQELHLRVPDGWMSGNHFRLVATVEGWDLVDAGSKNGTRVNGRKQGRVALADGDVIDAGRCFFVFRASAPVLPLDGPVLEVDAGGSRAGTLCGELREAFAGFERVAATSVPVLITGETGTGKEVVARILHETSGRTGAFVAVNCAAIPATLIESELFGHVRGSFSGADADRPGLIRAAHGGTLFLDEIADLPEAGQAALLRALQEREVMAVGSTQPVPVDFRVVAATNKHLSDMADAGAFRKDLFARLCGFSMRLPPLRARREDIGLLIGRLLPEIAPPLEHKAVRALFLHRWAFNIRELHQVLTAACALASEEIRLEDLRRQLNLTSGPDSVPPPSARRSRTAPVTRDQLVSVLVEHAGNISAIARALSTSRSQVRRLLRRFELDAEQYRTDAG